MQTANVNPKVVITVRHEEITDALRAHVMKKVDGLHLDYPRIIEVKVVLDVQKNRHMAEVILFCANHIVIEASSETEDMYKSMDETISKIARQMRKHKTRLLKRQRSRPDQSIKYLDEKIYRDEAMDHPEESVADPVPEVIHTENYRMRNLFKEEAILELEMSDKPFVVYTNARRGVTQIVYKRKDGEYAVIEP